MGDLLGSPRVAPPILFAFFSLVARPVLSYPSSLLHFRSLLVARFLGRPRQLSYTVFAYVYFYQI